MSRIPVSIIENGYIYEEILPTDTILVYWEYGFPPREIISKWGRVYWVSPLVKYMQINLRNKTTETY